MMDSGSIPAARAPGTRVSRSRTNSGRLIGVIIALLLPGCGQDPVAALVQALTSDDVAARRRAARELSAMGAGARPAAGALRTAAGDADRDVRRWACQALAHVPGEATVTTLRATLQDDAVAVRLAAAFALLQVAPEQRDYVDVLSTALRSGDGGVIVAVGRLGPRARWALPTLRALLDDRRPGIRRLAVEAIHQIGDDDDETRAQLAALAQSDNDDRVRDAAAAALQASRNSDAPR